MVLSASNVKNISKTTKVLKRRHCTLVHSGQFYMISFPINRKLKKKKKIKKSPNRKNTKQMQILAHTWKYKWCSKLCWLQMFLWVKRFTVFIYLKHSIFSLDVTSFGQTCWHWFKLCFCTTCRSNAHSEKI